MTIPWQTAHGPIGDSLEKSLGLPYTLNDRVLARFRSELLSVTLSSLDHLLKLSLLPPGLESVTSLSSLRVESWPFTNLKRLNTPTTRIKHHMWRHFANLEELKAIIIEIADFNVVPFLTKLLTRKTRVNTLIAIEADATGVLIPGDDVNGLKHVTWPLIIETTEPNLKRLLASPMPAIDPFTPETDAHIIENDTIGRVVSSFDVIGRDTQSISIPASATTAILTPPFQWTLAPTWMTLREGGLLGRSSLSALSCNPLSSSLVRLEVRNLVIYNDLILPETLRS